MIPWIVFGILSSLSGAAAVGFVLWRVLNKKLVTPVPVYETPAKKKMFLVPGDGGIYTLHEKRKCRVNDDEKAWKAEQDEKIRETDR